jgi:FAD/FMN-containing dehydrogenase
MSDWPLAPESTARREPERREGWGMASVSLCHVRRPTTAAEVEAALREARAAGMKVIPWGNGRSYGDTALNEAHMVLDLSRMDQIVDWDPESGLVTVQPGVTLEKLWKHIVRDGWWPAVVSGTMFTTIGGLVAANAHGKNHWRHGGIGEHVRSFTLLTADGARREVSAESDPDLFHAAIGGYGWLGVFTLITLQCKRVRSGRVEVVPMSEDDLSGMFRTFEHCRREEFDYVVGWIDAFPRGRHLGRGQIHAARYLKEGEDPEARETLHLERQELPSRLFGVLPKRWLWRLVRPFANRLGMRLINFGRHAAVRWRTDRQPRLEEHARFNFLLDYVPDWKRIYAPEGLIQYQFFLPEAVAEDTFRRALEMSQAAGLEPWLVVMKRHRPDPFWLSHALDGYSFACDFPVRPGRRGELWRLTQRFNRLVVESGGRFYFAKDSVLDRESVLAAWGRAAIGRFMALKRRLDPEGLLQSNQFRRLFGDGWVALAEASSEGEAVEPQPVAEPVAEPE